MGNLHRVGAAVVGGFIFVFGLAGLAARPEVYSTEGPVVFGMTTNVEVDMGIGQVWEDLVSTADVVLPMVYPSHYYNLMYGVRRPNNEPYIIVKSALEDGIRRSQKVGGPTAAIRPYLQAFTLGLPRYTPDHVREQIRAAYDAGIDSWVLWNARAAYDPRIFEAANRKSIVRAVSQVEPPRTAPPQPEEH